MEKKKIAILGAGPAGLSTAFFLTDEKTNPGWRDRYEVNVYQMGWRVGGKGATGRNPDACERIQEHGIHVFGNMYYNTLRMMNDCYRELTEQNLWTPEDKYTDMKTAFVPSQSSLLTDYFDEHWGRSLLSFPYSEQETWEGPVWPTTHQMATQMISLLGEGFDKILKHHQDEHGNWFENLWHRVERAAVEKLIDIAEVLLHYDAVPDPRNPGVFISEHHLTLLEVGMGIVKMLMNLNPEDAKLRGIFMNLDVYAALVRGFNAAALQPGFELDQFDDINYYDWLKQHGLSEMTLHSSIPQILPNTALCYEDGDTTQIPRMSAMAFIEFFFRQTHGKGSGAYFFRQGTGETVMRPLYRALVNRGVKFHFFHKLKSLVPDPELAEVNEICFEVQATVKSGTYEPLRPKAGSGEMVWPDRPLFDQLVEGEELKKCGEDLESWWNQWPYSKEKVLRKGEDFDQVVLATPVATLRFVAPKLIDHPAAGDKWRNMVTYLKTTATQNVQIWMNKSVEELGWEKLPLAGDRYIGPLYCQDLTSFCDFSDLIEQENWPEDNKPKSLLYFIGALSDPEVIPDFTDAKHPDTQKERIKWASIQYFRNISGLLPKASSNPVDPLSLDFNSLVTPDKDSKAKGVNRFASQFYKANIDPNERYTLSLPGTVKYRLEAWDSQFDNLVLAGDWIYTGFNVCSFEAACMSGKLASLAMTGSPGLENIYGYTLFHPSRQGPSWYRLGQGKRAAAAGA